ncbi:hypothetical protein BG011_008995 [Mortierella polycephala]|uniref:DUF7789 domain-containing protein n=1 Tax=Mortierella polycephala TaxID=41804 RepID=A0A9P6TX34_9FUNG|nr:hypothetical protein BG011_008995 [Mortierella polycephala]
MNNNTTSNNHNNAVVRQPTQQQQQQLQLQQQHQRRLQEQIQTEDSQRIQLQQDNQHHNHNQFHDQSQYRVQRPAPAQTTGSGGRQEYTNNNSNERNSAESKPPPSYYSYPPQPTSPSSSSLYSPSPKRNEAPFKARIRGLVQFPCSNYGKAMMLVIALEALLVIIMQVVIVLLYFQALIDAPLPAPTSGPYAGVVVPSYLDTRNQSRSIPAYLIVFVFAQLFQLVIAWDAVRAQNTIELIAVVVFNICCFAYSIFEISQIRAALESGASNGFFVPEGLAMELQGSLKPFLIVVIVVIGITQCAVIWLAYQLFQEFGWKIYKKIGADPNMKKMYRAYQIYLVLIKVDLFFFVGFSIQFIYLTLTRRSEDPEYWLTIFVLPLTVVILYIAVYAVRHESRKWMAAFLVAMLCGVVYFIFKVFRMYDIERAEYYVGVNQFLTLFATLCLITILATIANATLCYRNFGKGLKLHLLREDREARNTTSALGERVLEID